MQKTNNRGFSLVELIIVIAIMAVLIAVLAPQFLEYLEKSRLQKDESALEEVLNATKVALTVDEVYKEAAASGASVTITNNAKVTASPAVLQKELRSIVTDEIAFSSKKYANGGTQSISITFTNPDDGFILTPSWE